MSDPDVEMFNRNLMKALVADNDKMRAEIERLRNELRIRIEWFEKMGHPGMAEATRAVFKKN